MQVRWLTSLAARKSLYAPFQDPRGHQRACTGKRPVSRGEAPSAFNTAAVMRLHSRQVYLITRRQTWHFQRPSSLTQPLPSGAWWRATWKDGVMMMMMMTRVEAADSSHPFYILLKGLFLSFTMTELFIHLRSVCLSGNQNSLLLLRFRGETVEPDTRLLATNGIPPSQLSSSARCCKELSK